MTVMKVNVKLLASYRKLVPAGKSPTRFEAHIDPGTTLGELMARYGVPLTDDSVFLVNGLTPSGVDQLLQEGDVVAAFSAMAGG